MKRIMLAVIVVFVVSAALYAEDTAVATSPDGAQTSATSGISTAISSTAAAEIVTAVSSQTGGMVDLSAFLGKSRVGMTFTSNGGTWTTAYLPVLSWLPDKTSELLNLDGGVVYRPTDNKAGGMLALGLRVDNLIGMAFGGEYGKAHIKKATLPTLEVPAGYALIARQGSAPEGVYHVGFAVGF